MRQRRSILILFALLLATLACETPPLPDLPTLTPVPSAYDTGNNNPTAAPSTPLGLWFETLSLPVGYGARAPWIEIYFTNPLAPTAKSETGGVDEVIAQSIDQARMSVDVAIYSLSSPAIRDALIHAHQRGLQVRMVMESDSMDRDVPKAVKAAGIPIIGDRREGLMHNKFVVIDRSELWTGSLNFTVNGSYDDDNNMVLIRSTQIAEDYTTEFNEMFDDDLFGPDTRYDTPNPKVTLNGVDIEVYFSPDDGVSRRLVELVSGATESIYFLAYSFTSNPLAEAVRERAGAGVIVSGVMDKEQAETNTGGEYEPFLSAGLDVRLDGIPGLMHHKVLIIDHRIVVTGSYNFSSSAENRNDENAIIFFSEEIARQFLEEFARVYAAAGGQ
jgi:phosphatidylserine/phosphatidylglycerophosphate/cardiolipin synthase-like enzyme